MDSTPTSHRPRRGRKALEKCSSTPIRAILEDSASNRTSPSVSPMDRANTSWLTPSTDKSYIDGNEQLTRSALRREFHLEEEEDDYIMPCTQIVDPSANGEVFWNYNASPTTARARAALKERMSQIEENSIKEDKPNPSIPSPVLRIPMLPIRKKPTSATKEDPYVKEQQNKKEVDEMLNSMKDILKAELQKHHNPPIDNENRNFVDITQETKNNSFGKDGLVSDDDSFILRATQVIGDSEHREKYNRDNKTNSHMSRHDIKDQPEVHRGEAFDDSDDFDFLLSQMEMPRTEPQGSSNSDKTRFSHNSVNRNIEAEDYNSRNGSVNKDKDSTSDEPKSNSTSLNIRLPSVPDKKIRHRRILIATLNDLKVRLVLFRTFNKILMNLKTKTKQVHLVVEVIARQMRHLTISFLEEEICQLKC